jgi:uncharacterized membrane protein
MLRYFILVIENTLGTALLVALIAAEKPRRLLWSTMIGIASALVFAVLQRTVRFVNRGFVNTGILLIALLAGLLFVPFSWGFLRKNRVPFRGTLLNISAQILTAALLAYTLAPIFLYPTEFALPGEAVFTTDFLFKLIGWTFGVCLSALIALGLFRIGGNLQPDKVGEPIPLRAVLSLALAINGIRQLTAICQFLMARRIIPLNLSLFRIIAALANHDRVFLYILMALGFVVPALFLFNCTGAKHDGTFRNPAEARKYRAYIRGLRRICGAQAAGLFLGFCAITLIKAGIEQAVVLSPAEAFTLVGNDISLPVEQVRDGRLHRFAYTASDATEVRFIVILKNENSFGVGLDACDICGATGYYERKDEVICKLCDVVMNKQTIGFKGGCNPVPLAFKIENGVMLINTGDLEKEKGRFK